MKTLEQLAREALEEVHAGWLMDENDMACQTGAILHVAEAIRAACRAEALEEAAQRCEKWGNAVLDESGVSFACAAAIRELK